MFNPVIIIAIVIQMLVNKASRKAGAILGFVITAGILIWGISLYSDGDAIALFGLTLSQPIFILICLVWFAFDVRDLIAANKSAPVATQPQVSQNVTPPVLGQNANPPVMDQTTIPPAINQSSQIPPAFEYQQLSIPCRIIFYRDSSFVGALVAYSVNLNGRRVGEVKNGKSIEFQTNLRSNAIIVTDNMGQSTNAYRFNGVDGGVVQIHYKNGVFN